MRSSPERWAAGFVAALLLACDDDADIPPPGPACALPQAQPPTIVQLDGGSDTFMALFSDGSVRCWGSNAYGECAVGWSGAVPFGIAYERPVRSVELSCQTQLDARGHIALDEAGTIRYWGFDLGALRGKIVETGVATPLADVNGTVSVEGWGPAAYARTAEGDLYHWGEVPSDGHEVTFLSAPTLVAVPKVTAVRAGPATCALDTSGALWCWGWNDQGVLGDGTQVARLEPRPVDLPEPVVAFDVSSGFTACAVLASGAVYCWGNNSTRKLGRGDFKDITDPVPAPVAVFPDAIDIRVGGEFVCAITRSRGLMCWGYTGWLRFDESTTLEVPTPIEGVTDVLQVALTDDTFCVLRTDGNVWCEGSTTGRPGPEGFAYGPLDFSTTIEPEAPGRVPPP